VPQAMRESGKPSPSSALTTASSRKQASFLTIESRNGPSGRSPDSSFAGRMRKGWPWLPVLRNTRRLGRPSPGCCFPRRLSHKPNRLYEFDNGRFCWPRESRPGGTSGSFANQMVQPKTVTLWQTYKKSTTTLVCATASARSRTRDDGAQMPGLSAMQARGVGRRRVPFQLAARAGVISRNYLRVFNGIWRGATPWPGFAPSSGVDRGYCRRDP
jgi:hypothetical protein